MGCQIIRGCGIDPERDVEVMYSATRMWTVGPVFHGSGSAAAFMRWLVVDPCDLAASSLERLYNQWIGLGKPDTPRELLPPVRAGE